MATERWIGALALALAALGCEVRDDSCPPQPRDRTLCFDEQQFCAYGASASCPSEWECTCEDGRWDCRATGCANDVPDGFDARPDAWPDAARDTAGEEAPEAWVDADPDAPPPDAWKDAPPETGWDVAPGCPADVPIGSGAACEPGLQCEYGTECCCGACHPSLVCQCTGGGWGCYYTDACMIPGCPDVDDAFEAQEPGDAADAPDVPPLDPGQCRTDADCDTGGGMWSWCASPDEPQSCGMCFRPDATCWTSADCAGTPEAPVCAPSRAPCLCEPDVRECMPRCDAPGTTQACDAVTQQCDADTGLCVVRRCEGHQDCAVNFRCRQEGDLSNCRRLSCSWDGDCDTGWCVNGACHYEPGTCDFPKP